MRIDDGFSSCKSDRMTTDSANATTILVLRRVAIKRAAVLRDEIWNEVSSAPPEQAGAPRAQILDCRRILFFGLRGVRACRPAARRRGRRGRAGAHRDCPHHERCRLLRRRRHGLFQGRRHRGDHDAVQFRGPDDGAARLRRSRCRRRHGVGRLLQLHRARHRHQDRRRSGLHEARLRIFLPDGAQGPGRFRGATRRSRISRA